MITFGQLKAGDTFFYHCGEYEKISGNYAVDLYTEEVVEFNNEEVRLPEGEKE